MGKVQQITKVVRPGAIIDYEGRTRPVDVYCKITFKSNGELTISGVVGPLRSGNAIGGAGQIDIEFDHRDKNQNGSHYSKPISVDQIKFAEGWNADLWYGFLNIWRIYHLNRAKSTCEHQALMGMTYQTHPSHTCPICGWRAISVPDSVIEFLCYLPDSDKIPAWV